MCPRLHGSVSGRRLWLCWEGWSPGVVTAILRAASKPSASSACGCRRERRQIVVGSGSAGLRGRPGRSRSRSRGRRCYRGRRDDAWRPPRTSSRRRLPWRLCGDGSRKPRTCSPTPASTTTTRCPSCSSSGLACCALIAFVLGDVSSTLCGSALGCHSPAAVVNSPATVRLAGDARGMPMATRDSFFVGAPTLLTDALTLGWVRGSTGIGRRARV